MNPIDNDIKSKNFHNLYLIYGDENFLRLNYKKKLKKALVPENDTMNFTKFDKFNIDVKSLVDLANTMPLFAERRVIVVDDCNLFSKSNDDLAEYLKKPNESTVLIFTEESVDKRTNVFKAIKSNGLLQECVLPKDKVKQEQEIASWIGSRLKKLGKKIKKDAWNEFYNRSSLSYSLIDSEFEKLISYVGDKEVIELSDVEAICTGAVEAKVFEMIEAISSKDLDLTMKHYRALIEEREEPVKIIRLLQTQFNKILIAKNMSALRYSNQEIANASGIGAYFVGKTLNLSKNFTQKEVLDFLEKAADYDQKVKSGLIDSHFALELLIMEYMK